MGTSLLTDVAMIIANLLIAILIGATAIGGLLLAPSLHLVGDVPIHVAIPSCMLSFVFSGTIGYLIQGRNGRVPRNSLIALIIGAGSSAFVGSFVLAMTPAIAVMALVSGLCIISGVHALTTPHRFEERQCALTPMELFVAGALTGFGSALTGTGGPLILLPILFVLKANLRQAVTLAQAIQIPVGLLATAGNMIMGRVDFSVAIPVTITVVVGVAIGALIARRASNRWLKSLVSVLLILSGTFYLAQIAL